MTLQRRNKSTLAGIPSSWRPLLQQNIRKTPKLFIKMDKSREADIRITGLSLRDTQVKCAITQESVKYQNKLLTEMLFSQELQKNYLL